MKMLKKLLAIVLTGAMALSLFTACGSNAVTEKDIADALNDIIKCAASGQPEPYTFKPRAAEREMAKAIAALSDEDMKDTEQFGQGTDTIEVPKKAVKILGIDAGGENEKSRFVWCGATYADGIGAAGQACMLLDFLDVSALNAHKLTGKEPAETRYMGTALYKTVDKNGNPMTVRIVVVIAEAVDES